MDSTIVELNNFDRSTNESLSAMGVRAQVRRRHRRIQPLQDETREVKPKRKIDDAFGWIYIFGMYSGLPISKSLYSSKQQRFKRFVLNALSKTWILIYSVSSVCTFIYAFYMFDTPATQLCLSLRCFFCFVAMWAFLIKKRQIKTLIKKLCHLSTSLDFDADGVKSRLSIYYTVAYLHFLSSGLVFWLFFFYLYYEQTFIQMRNQTPFAVDSALDNSYIIFLMVALSTAFTGSTLFQHFFVTLSSEAYRTSGQLLVLYGSKLLRDIDRNSFTATTANSSISQYKAISSCISEVDRLFGISTLVVFLESSIEFFGAASLFLAQDKRIQESKLVTIFGIVALIMGFVMLCYLIYSGEKVRQGSRSLDRQLMAMSHSLMCQSPDTSTLVMFHLLLQDIKTTKSCVTVMGLFEITTKSLLSILSLILSYNVTLWQLGANST